MAQHHLPDLPDLRAGRDPSCLVVAFQLPEDPRIASGSPADHNAVAAGLLHHVQGVLHASDVPVSDDRDAHRLFHLPDDVPVRFSGIVLLSCPPVDCHSSGPRVLDDPGNLHRVDAGVVKSLPDLDGHRFPGRFHCPGHDLVDKPGLLHQGGALPVLHHLGHRAAHVDVQDLEGQLLQGFGLLADHIRF